MPASRWIAHAQALVIVSAVAGCGGGGGGGEASPSATPPGVAPPPLALSTVFTGDGAAKAATVVFDGIGYVSYAAEMASFAANEVTVLGPHTSRCRDATGREFPMPVGLIDQDASGTVSGGDTVTIDYADCDTHMAQLRFAIRSIDRTTARIDGRVTFRLERSRGTTILDGTFDFNSSYLLPRSLTRQTVANLVFTSTTGGATDSFVGASLERAFDTNIHYTLRLSGSVSSPRLGGEFAFSTPVAFGGSFHILPATGELLLTAGATRARFVARDVQIGIPEFFDYAVDVSGTGYGKSARQHWLAITNGSLFGVTPSPRPVISSFELTPASPHAGDPLKVTYTVERPVGELVTESFTWRRNGAVLTSFAGDTAAARQFRRGDVIEVELRVSNGRWSDLASASVTLGNEPPSATSLTLSPPAARSVDDLTLLVDAADGDGDAVQIHYEWRRNGVAIPGYHDRILPESAHARSDVITGAAILSDGTATTVAEISVTIGDSPPRVTAVSPPLSAGYASHVSFVATAVDPDGDAPGRFELAYGPAGMTVHPTTGVVAWQARTPMFDDPMEIRWGVTTDYPGAVPADGVIAVRDAARAPVIMRTGLQLSQPAGLAVDDFDGDGDAEILVLSLQGLYELSGQPGGYRQSWVYPFALSSGLNNRAFTTSDVDGDGRHEIFVAQGDVIAKLDGVNRRLVARKSVATDASDGCTDLEVGDVDADGRAEVVCVGTVSLTSPPYHSRTIVVMDAEALTLEWQAPLAEYGASLVVANLDLDPQLEIATNAGYVFDGSTRTLDWRYLPGFGRSQLASGDLDGDGVAEIVAATDVGFDPGDPGTIRAFDAQARALSWTVANAETTALTIADVVGDSRAELLVGSGGTSNVYAYAMTGPAAMTAVLSRPSMALSGVVAIEAGDVDNDGDREIVWSASPLALTIVGPAPSFAVEWRSAYDRTLLRGPFSGGIWTANGANPRIPLFMSFTSWEACASGARLVTLDPTTTELRLAPHDFGEFASQGFALDAFDYDGDNVDEALVGLAPSAGATYTAYDVFDERVEWASLPSAGEYGPAAIAHGDFNSDGFGDLVAIGTTGVRSFDIRSGSSLGQQATTDGVDVEVAELNGSGPPEILVTERTYLRTFEWKAGGFTPLGPAVSPGEVRDTAIGDVDGDGRADIIVIAATSHDTTAVHRFDEALTWVGSFNLPWRASSVALEESPFPRKNLVLSTATYTGEIVVVDARGGQEIWRSPPLNGQIARESVHFDNSGGPRVSVATNLGVYVTR